VIDHPDPMAMCRCGHSSNKPFCDGTHATIDFDGTLAN
jgi:CDGSH-type Zn-finger protein